MIWLLLLLLFSGCVSDPNIEQAQQTISQYISYLEAHSGENYTLNWTYNYWKDGVLAKNISTSVYNNALIRESYGDYSVWFYDNRTCFQVFEYAACEEGGFDAIKDKYFWTPAFIQHEREFFNVLLNISKVKATNTTLNFLYNYSGLSYAEFQALGVNPSIFDKVRLVNLTYWFNEDGALKRLRKEVYGVNNTTYIVEINYSDLALYDSVPELEPNASITYVKMAIAYIQNLPKPLELRETAVEYRMPFLCRYDTNITVCLDVYITKTKDVSACRYAPNPEECFGVYNATAGS